VIDRVLDVLIRDPVLPPRREDLHSYYRIAKFSPSRTAWGSRRPATVDGHRRSCPTTGRRRAPRPAPGDRETHPVPKVGAPPPIRTRRDRGMDRSLPSPGGSGRWQARYRDASGQELAAPHTFATKGRRPPVSRSGGDRHRAGRVARPSTGRVTFGGWAADYTEAARHKRRQPRPGTISSPAIPRWPRRPNETGVPFPLQAGKRTPVGSRPAVPAFWRSFSAPRPVNERRLSEIAHPCRYAGDPLGLSRRSLRADRGAERSHPRVQGSLSREVVCVRF
jgi:hypothetical protein